MSENSTPDERTEMPTARRWGKIREEGQTYSSPEVVLVLVLLTGFTLLFWISAGLFAALQAQMELSFRRIGDLAHHQLSESFLFQVLIEMLWSITPSLAPLFLCVAAMAVVATMLQTNWNVKKKWVEVKFSQLSPLKGLSRVFSRQGLVNTGKALLKLSVIVPLAFFGLRNETARMLDLVSSSIPMILMVVGDIIWILFWKIWTVLVVIALIDYFYGRWSWLRNIKMTKQEVKDERKSIEGDEATRQKIKFTGLQRIAQRIASSVPTADVVITNPTHYAVALKYDRANMAAPIVVAKGKGHLALRIREIAKESNVPIVERKWLARSLFASAEVGVEIPYELFRAVAEVLAYIYRIKGRFKRKNAEG